MSDTEDAQDIKKMADDGFLYQLRKIGPAASCPKVPEMMRLSLGLTRIGRGQHNDYFLDSALLKNFISRSHVEITGKKNENGEIEYVMNDKGLNGTFVNDVRTQKTCILELGDKITFGHTNGYKIEPGSYAEQPKSEFQFIFERVPNSTKTTEVCDDTNHEEPAESPIPDTKKDSGIDRSFLSDLQSNNHVQKSSSKSKTSQSVRSRKDSDSMSDSDKVVDTKPKGSKKSGKSETVSRSSVKKEELTSKRKSSTGSLNKFSETLPAMKNDDDDDDDDEEDDDDDKNDDESNDDSKSESESEEEEEVIPKKKRKLPPRKTAPQSSQKKITPKGKKVIQKDSSSDSDDSSDNESSKPEADQKPKQSQTSSRQKVTTAASATRKKRSSGNTAPVVANKRKKRKTSSTKTSATVSADVLENLEPGVEWYDEDRCDSADCKRPKKKRTPWVQCDDCDGWYHTVCVGANYNQLKDSDARFNCGCIS